VRINKVLAKIGEPAILMAGSLGSGKTLLAPALPGILPKMSIEESLGVTRVRKKVVRNIAVIFQKSCLPLARSGNPMATAILPNHIATSLLALIEWWLDNDMKPAPAQMGKVYKSLIIDSTEGAMRSLLAVIART
jgi:hypothetical protein